MQIQFSRSEFSDYGPHCDGFDAWLFEASKSKANIKMELTDSDVYLRIDESSYCDAANLELAENGLPFAHHPLSVGARLLIPLVAEIRSLEFPIEQIYAMRAHNRSVADFWVRNLFHALNSRNGVRFLNTRAVAKGAQREISKDFSRRYLWYLRSVFPDPSLKQKNILEKILVASYFPVIELESEVLNAGLANIRKVNKKLKTEGRLDPEMDAERKRFDECRTNIMQLLN
ncbi:MAG: hypothetical protein ACX94B_00315 [Henriciella sp.]